MPDLVNGTTVITTPTGPSTQVQVPVKSSVVVTTPGSQGPPGSGVQLEGAVPTYGDLPDDLGPSDNGAAYVVNSSGKLYVWDGTAFPLEANGADFKGDQGDPGRGVDDVQLIGDDVIRFVMSDASNENITVPTITAANASAVAAAASASAASSSATSASGSATAASGSATAASGSATAASGSASAASGSASTATTQAGLASTARTGAETAEDNALASAVAADASADAALASQTAASGSASNAATSATTSGTAKDLAVAAQGNAEAARDLAEDYRDDASDSADAAAASAIEAADVVSSGIPNATDVVKGGVLLPGAVAGELGGTWDHPTVTGWSDVPLLVGGLIPSGYIPPIALVNVQTAANTAARLALTAQAGDVAVQTGNPGRGTYILKSGGDPTVDADWILSVSPTDAVTSVNGYTGIVVLAKADVGLGSVDNTADTAKPVSTAQQTALDGKANTAHSHAGADITSGTVAYARLPVGTASSTVAAGDDSRITGATPTSRSVSAGTGLTGGGTLAADRTLSADFGTGAGKVTQGNDSRLSDARTPSANTVPSDFVFVAISPGTTRSTTEDWTNGQYVGRAFTLIGVTYQFETADASGNTSVEVQRRAVGGAYSTVANTNLTISAANQADTDGAADTARTNASAVSQSFAVGDRINVICTAVGTTPGKGLRVYLKGTWN